MKTSPISYPKDNDPFEYHKNIIHDWDQLVQLIHDLHPNSIVKLEGLRSSFPALVFQCKTVSDIRSALSFAKSQRLAFVVRDGGLNNFNYPNKECVIIDISSWNKCEFSKDTSIVNIQAGCTRMDILEKSYYFRWRVPDALFIYLPSQSLALRGYNLSLQGLIGAKFISVDGKVHYWKLSQILSLIESGFTQRHLGIVLSVEYEY